jgi:hypothetical protein
MKRGERLRRVTPLTAKSQPQRTGSKPKVKRRKPGEAAAEKRARAVVRERSGGMCEVAVPGVCMGRATNYQHRKNRSQGGEYSPSAALDCCGSGTQGCHGYLHAHPAVAYRWGWSVRQHHDPAGIPVRLANSGWPMWFFLREDGSTDPVSYDDLLALRERFGLADVEWIDTAKEAS